jgi:RND family efflux transporter MFP subunit
MARVQLTYSFDSFEAKLIAHIRNAALVLATALTLMGCHKQAAQSPGTGQGQGMPVKTITVNSSPVPQSDDYVATIKSRRTATINPQVYGNVIKITAHSGDKVAPGDLLMEIDPIKQEATYESQVSTEKQKLAVYEYNRVELERQKRLFDAGVTSRNTLDQAEQAYKNSKADYEAAVASRLTQERELSYYHIQAPFAGTVGDIPVHIGDYVSPSTVLTTVDEGRDLEAYIYIPSERAGQVRDGLSVDILDNSGRFIEHTQIYFVSLQVDNGLQGILAKAKIRSGPQLLRNAQLVKARVIWSSSPLPVVPVLSVSRLGGQAFVYVAQGEGDKFVAKQRAVKLGDTVGNDYAVLGGLKNGDKVIVSGTQFLVDGVPVQPLG